jgi:Protein of unknown function (DUF3592)
MKHQHWRGVQGIFASRCAPVLECPRCGVASRRVITLWTFMFEKVTQFALIALAAFAAVVFETGKPVGSVMLTKIVLLAAAAGVVVWHWRKIRLGMASNTWPKTKGTVLASNMDFVEDADDRERGYWVSVEYTYKVGLQLFKSSRLTFEKTSHLTLDEARQLLSGIQNEREIDVYYNPEQKSQSVIFPGASAKSKWWFALWLALFVAVLVVAKYWRPS